MSFNNTESFCTMTMSVFYRKVLRLDVGMISWANFKCMNIVKLSVNQWTSIFPPSSPVWLNATCTLAVTDGGQRSATLLSRTPWRWHTASPTTTRQQLKIWRPQPDIPTLTVCLFSHRPNQVVTRWWSADSSAPTFTHVSRTYSCRSDGMITKSWCRMQIWTPLFFNAVFKEVQ